jgi:hypothetical protein
VKIDGFSLDQAAVRFGYRPGALRDKLCEVRIGADILKPHHKKAGAAAS